MLTAREWKTHYAHERAKLGDAGLHACLDRAPTLDLPTDGALVFPHTRLDTSGELAAAAALAVLRSGRDVVLALGVLHGARAADAALVRRARDGEPDAHRILRRVHGPGVPGDGGYWTEEFSLDGFCALLETAALRSGTRLPRVVCRYPFLVGPNPADLPGIDELQALVADGAVLVATADPMHHGVGYGTPTEDCLPRESPHTQRIAEETIRANLALLATRDFDRFLLHTAEIRSDFRDTGPVATHLLPDESTLQPTLHNLALVDYADILDAPAPTWVAGALASLRSVAIHRQPTATAR